jgi:hypothetical protein
LNSLYRKYRKKTIKCINKISCDVNCLVNGALTLFIWYIDGCVLMSARMFMCSTKHLRKHKQWRFCLARMLCSFIKNGEIGFTDTQRHGHHIYVALSCSETSTTSRKVIKVGVLKFYFPHEFNIPHSDASRSKKLFFVKTKHSTNFFF